jgi:predicted acetyltransferase
MSRYELRPVRPDEVEAFMPAVTEAFHRDPDPARIAIWREFVEPARTLAAFDDGAIVATSGLLTLELAVPGGTVPMAGVTAVGVHALHRGRGLLDRMMRRHLERMTEPIAGLWASEAAIYGRYGFGLATRVAELTVHSPSAVLRAPVEQELRAARAADAIADLRAIYDAAWRERPGLLARDERVWRGDIAELEHDVAELGRLRALLTDGGYVLYAIRKRDDEAGRPDDVVEIQELLAATPAATAALWQHLIGLSLARSVHWTLAPEDEPLPHLLTDVRAATVRLSDALHIRIMDLPAALTARSYSAPIDVVLEVDDPVLARNAGRWRLTRDACERTASPADLALGVEELGAAYLGGTTLAQLAAAGRVTEHTPGALGAASAAFAAPRAPWACEEF